MQRPGVILNSRQSLETVWAANFTIQRVQANIDAAKWTRFLAGAEI